MCANTISIFVGGLCPIATPILALRLAVFEESKTNLLVINFGARKFSLDLVMMGRSLGHNKDRPMNSGSTTSPYPRVLAVQVWRNVERDDASIILCEGHTAMAIPQ